MPINPFTRRELLRVTTTLPWTTDFRHLGAIPRFWLKRTSVRDPAIKSVRPSERIKWWNIVPGDQIRLLGDKSNTLHEVLSINRISNRVFVKGVVDSNEQASNKVPQSKNYHYSRCQLFLGDYELPAGKESTSPRRVPVYAQRLGTTAPIWNPFLKRYDWERFATKTVPTVASQKGERINIPWPKYEKPPLPEATGYDTPREVVAQATYRPPAFHPSVKEPLPQIPSEQEFLAVLYNPHRKAKFDESAPAEVFLHRELSNPHGTAKKLSRWRAYQGYKKRLLNEFKNKEYENLNGRTLREAGAEAGFKLREQLKKEKEADKKRRWMHKAAEVGMVRKAERKVRKQQKLRKKLSELVLKDEPNQVIPKTARTNS